MRRDKRDRGRPLDVGDLQAIATFRAELLVYRKLRDRGADHDEAMRAVFGGDS